MEAPTHTTITLQNIEKFTTPFTIVTKNIDLVIKGNVDNTSATRVGVSSDLNGVELLLSSVWLARAALLSKRSNALSSAWVWLK